MQHLNPIQSKWVVAIQIPSGNLCYMNEHGDILAYTPMKKYST